MQEHIVIGAGLAGVEAAWSLAKGGVKVRLFEAKPKWFSPAHKSEDFAELICSNSLKSEVEGHASALLKEEMRSLGSIVLEAADAARLPAGKALAVDRAEFSKYITGKISSHPNIEVIREEIKTLPKSYPLNPVVIATGPLTSPALMENLQEFLTCQHANLPTFQPLYFYDAIAPIVEADSIDMNMVFRGSRYGVGKRDDGDYLNSPFTRAEYDLFVEQLCNAQEVKLREFEEARYFEACMPVEVMARRHKDALRHGPMKPMGFVDPRTGKMPYALVQLRQEDIHAALFNIVGFQTRMTYKEQDRVFRLIPGLANAKFARYGSMHRNTYINGPMLLDDTLQLKTHPGIYMAGQITGVEGYLESAATGLYAGAVISGYPKIPEATAIGSLIRHIVHSDPENYQPMKMMWGIFPAIDSHPSTSSGPKREMRREILLRRAREDFGRWSNSKKL